MDWRDDTTLAKYKAYKQTLSEDFCIFCSPDTAILKDFKYWRIKINDFPYTLMSDRHHLLYPKRHIASSRLLSKEEVDELHEIRETYLPTEDYDTLAESMPRFQSIPGHLHLHLMRYRDISSQERELMMESLMHNKTS